MPNVCHYRRHLKGCALSVFEFALGLAQPPERILYASNETLADGSGYSVESITAARKKLVQLGWFEKLGGNRDLVRAGGKFQPDKYKVLTHEEWIQAHPGQCPAPRFSRNGETPSREMSVTEETRIPVTGKIGVPVTGKPPRNLRYKATEKESGEKGVGLFSRFEKENPEETAAFGPPLVDEDEDRPYTKADAWRGLELEPVGSAQFVKRFEHHFMQMVDAEEYDYLSFLDFRMFLRSFVFSCRRDGLTVPAEFTAAAVSIGADLG